MVAGNIRTTGVKILMQGQAKTGTHYSCAAQCFHP